MQEYMDFAQDIAIKAGDIMLQYFKLGVSYERKDDNTHLTIADSTINRLVIDAVQDKYPDHSVLGEEESNSLNGSSFVWVCDPIDGTLPFVFGLTTNVFMLTLVQDGVPLLGVAYDPHLNRMFNAQRGKGAFLDDKKLSVNNLEFKDSVIGCSGKKSEIVDTPQFHADIERGCHRMVFISCVVYEGMLTAAGQLGGHIYAGSNPYDGVASALFVVEAGGRVTNLLGEQQLYNQEIKGVVATNGVVHEQILAIAKKNYLKSSI